MHGVLIFEYQGTHPHCLWIIDHVDYNNTTLIMGPGFFLARPQLAEIDRTKGIRWLIRDGAVQTERRVSRLHEIILI